ncbi:MAG: response regulator [Alphaproteobacteria bacterium]|nr:response regulator [Alphaproteobacteria bacterium]
MADPRHVTAVRSSIRSIAGVLDDFVETARSGPARQSRHGAVDLRRLVEDAAAVTRTEIGDKDIVVETSISDDVPPVIEGQEIELQRILGNLLSNSARETKRGTIRISVRRPDPAASWLRVEVADTGPGLSAAQAQSFYEGDSVGELGGGAVSEGFGLRVVRRLVAALGGRLGGTSSPELGTTIWFDVPAPAASLRLEAEAAADLPAIRGLRLLLVEDEPLTAAATMALLHADGQEVVQAATPQDAVRLAAGQPFDLVLMDLDLAGRSGLTAIRSIRRLRDPVRAAVPIIVLTGDREAGDEACKAPLGVQSVLVKPFDFPSLGQAIATAVGLAPAPAIDVNRGTRPFLDTLAAALAPADLERLLATAREQIAGNREALEAAARTSRLREAKRAAHRLAGSAAIVGMTDLTETARRAEKAARDRDRRELAAMLDPIRRTADAALLELQSFGPAPAPDRLSAE